MHVLLANCCRSNSREQAMRMSGSKKERIQNKKGIRNQKSERWWAQKGPRGFKQAQAQPKSIINYDYDSDSDSD
jgi:hypothetical protein